MDTSTRTRIAAASLVLGPLLFTVGDVLRRLVEPSGSNLSGTDIVTAIGQHGPTWLAAGLLALAAAFFFVVGVTGLIATASGRGARLTTVGAVMVGVGAIASVGHAMGYYFFYAALSTAHTPGPEIDALDGAVSYPMIVVVILLFIVGLVLGPIVLFLGLRRARRVPIWAVVAAVAFAILGNTSGVGAGILGIVAAMAAFVPAARSLTRAPTEAPADSIAEAPLRQEV